MAAELNHTIVWCRDQARSATELAALLGLSAPSRFGPFLVVEAINGVSLDFHETDDPIAPQHYAFLIDEDDFDRIHARLLDEDRPHWADPGQHDLGRINHHDGGRGVYFEDPDGHLLEVITRPYGSGPGEA